MRPYASTASRLWDSSFWAPVRFWTIPGATIVGSDGGPIPLIGRACRRLHSRTHIRTPARSVDADGASLAARGDVAAAGHDRWDIPGPRRVTGRRGRCNP